MKLYILSLLMYAMSTSAHFNGEPSVGEKQASLKVGETASSNSLEVEGFEDLIKNTLDEFHTPGIAIAVIHKDNTWAKVGSHATVCCS